MDAIVTLEGLKAPDDSDPKTLSVPQSKIVFLCAICFWPFFLENDGEETKGVPVPEAV